MLKAIYKNLAWAALPLALALGCAANRPATEAEASYAPLPGGTLQPTSAEPEQRIYTQTDSGVQTTDASANVVPAGATPESWAVAEEIRQKLTEDTSFAPLGSSLIAEVGKDGVVTVRGDVSSPSEQQRVCDTISSLPGVRGVNNQLAVGKSYGSGKLNTMGQ